MKPPICAICEKELTETKKGLQHKGPKQPIHPPLSKLKGKFKKIKNGIEREGGNA